MDDSATQLLISAATAPSILNGALKSVVHVEDFMHLPTTENDFLSAGVSYEEAGEKWRAGDALKSTRFFLRAIEQYNHGLKIFPMSSDLAYNSARLQYEMTQQPRLLTHLEKPLLELLQRALEAHKVALNLDQDNADILFNTAQVLTSLAETICEGKNSSKQSRDEALGFFQEALTYFNRCLKLQELQMSEAAEQHSRMDDTMTIFPDDNAEPAEGFEQRTSDERWATIIEPVTNSTLIDTVIAQLETLTAFCSLLGSYGQFEFQWVKEYYDGNLRDKIMVYTGASERKRETLLARARFTSALTDVAFRLALIDITTYERELNTFFSFFDVADNPQALCDKADAEITLSSSIGIQLPLLLQSQDLASLNGMRWKYLSLALDDLTTAAKLPDVQNVARVHLRRGDCEMLRYQLGQAPTHYDRAFKSASVLIMNAGTYYRGAAGFSKGSIEDEREAIIKEAIIRSLSGDMDKLEPIRRGSEEVKSALAEVVAEMKEEGLLSNEAATAIAELLPGNIT